MKPKLKVVFRIDSNDNVFGIFPEDLIEENAASYSHVDGYFETHLPTVKEETKAAPKVRAMKMLEQMKNLSGYENVELVMAKLTT